MKAIILAACLLCGQSDEPIVVVPAFETASLINLLEANGHKPLADALRSQWAAYKPTDQWYQWDRECYVEVHRLLRLVPPPVPAKPA